MKTRKKNPEQRKRLWIFVGTGFVGISIRKTQKEIQYLGQGEVCEKSPDKTHETSGEAAHFGRPPHRERRRDCGPGRAFPSSVIGSRKPIRMYLLAILCARIMLSAATKKNKTSQVCSPMFQEANGKQINNFPLDVYVGIYINYTFDVYTQHVYIHARPSRYVPEGEPYLPLSFFFVFFFFTDI